MDIITAAWSDPSGIWRVQIRTTTQVLLNLKYDHQPTQQELQQVDDAYSKVDYEPSAPVINKVDVSEYELMRWFVLEVRAHPTLTLSQLTNWLNANKQWHEVIRIRSMILDVAEAIGEHYNVDVTDMSENVVWLRLRNFLVNTPLKVVSSCLFNDDTYLD